MSMQQNITTKFEAIYKFLPGFCGQISSKSPLFLNFFFVWVPNGYICFISMHIYIESLGLDVVLVMACNGLDPYKSSQR
jgi:hypothetical protein